MINKLALGFLMGASSVCVFAQTSDVQVPPNDGYSQDVRGTVTRSAYGLCWRSGSWTDDDAVAGCDGALKSPIPNPIAPEIATNAGRDQLTLPTKRCDFTATLEDDQTFSFGKTTLNNQARKRIRDDILPKLAQCKTVTGIAITGHTDSIGTRRSKQKLSEKRAEAVAAYLRENGVATAMHALGASDTQPLVSCNNKMAREKLVACLAPNRRVFIKVNGGQK